MEDADASLGGPKGASGNSCLRVLIVEDDFIQAAEAEAALREAGFLVAGIAKSVGEATALAKSERPDLVIMDVRLAGTCDGIDAALAIFWTTGTRCIFATAYDDARTRAQAGPAEPLGWIAKPYSSRSLVDAVKRADKELKKS